MEKTQKRPRKVLRGNISGITGGALRRIMYRAGIPRREISINEELRGILKQRLENIIQQAIVFMEHNKRKTIMEKDIRAVANMAGKELIASNKITSAHGKISEKKRTEGTKKKRKSKPGTVALRKIKKYQSMPECLLIPVLPFTRLVREIGQSLSDVAYNYQKNALTVLQMWIENELVNLCYNGFLIAHHTGRDTLMVKDIVLVRQIQGGTTL